MGLHDIKNERILKFREKLLGYPLKFVHVEGLTYSVAERLSCYPEKENTYLDLEDRFIPSVASKSLRTKQSGKNPTDPHINKIASIARSDEDYKYMIDCIRNKVPIKSIKESSELKQIQGQYDNLSLYNTSEGDIIIHDAQDILIPKGYRKDIIAELHSTHLADTSMINLAKGKCYWPSMKEELKNTYKSCEVCLENAISKPAPHYEVIPSFLKLLQPNEIIHLDYMEIGKINILVLKCKA